jgi:hypothetical protein
MSIKAINKKGRSMVLRVDSFETMRKIADRFERWEFVS